MHGDQDDRHGSSLHDSKVLSTAWALFVVATAVILIFITNKGTGSQQVAQATPELRNTEENVLDKVVDWA